MGGLKKDNVSSLKHLLNFKYKNFVNENGDFNVDNYMQYFIETPDVIQDYYYDCINFLQAKLDEIKDNGGYDSDEYHHVYDKFIDTQQKVIEIITEDALRDLKTSLVPLKAEIERLKSDIKSEKNVSRVLQMIDSILNVVAAVIAIISL
ncbi:MAG: hypothetical protein E6997_00355 [Citrobacter sp.]|uniref:hypothetical protein n=1 Tax=Citrobacter braakii TaxID=57706 RepID=UPI0019017C96|nr:hypothetical protein [Citrobacter braakii]MBJ8952088.1 hypothetical protein [Citrobacter braakii]MDU1181448.1 hypothetical protein [Citrobacter sp.]